MKKEDEDDKVGGDGVSVGSLSIQGEIDVALFDDFRSVYNICRRRCSR